MNRHRFNNGWWLSLAVFLIFMGCDAIEPVGEEQAGEICEAKTNKFGRCNVNQLCDKGECKDQGMKCLAAGAAVDPDMPNTNGYGYCLEGHVCRMNECIKPIFCSEEEPCRSGMQCTPEGNCVCGTQKTICGDSEQCCEDAGDSICIHLNNSHMLACGQCHEGMGNCNADWTDGCETVLEDLNLVACGVCKEGFGNCNEDWQDGCEVDLASQNLAACDACSNGFCAHENQCVDANTSNRACGEACLDCSSSALGGAIETACEDGICVALTCLSGAMSNGRICCHVNPNSVVVMDKDPESCQYDCIAGFTKCGEQCVNLDTHSANCGGCGVQCVEEEHCENASCLSNNCRDKHCTGGKPYCCENTKTNVTTCVKNNVTCHEAEVPLDPVEM